jgi:hypothetical protein
MFLTAHGPVLLRDAVASTTEHNATTVKDR